jgi:hypothetical protein
VQLLPFFLSGGLTVTAGRNFPNIFAITRIRLFLEERHDHRILSNRKINATTM